MNSVASGMHCVKVVEDIVVKSSRSLSHLLMSLLLYIYIEQLSMFTLIIKNC